MNELSSPDDILVTYRHTDSVLSVSLTVLDQTGQRPSCDCMSWCMSGNTPTDINITDKKQSCGDTGETNIDVTIKRNRRVVICRKRTCTRHRVPLDTGS
jgi:hypothetical protein